MAMEWRKTRKSPFIFVKSVQMTTHFFWHEFWFIKCVHRPLVSISNRISHTKAFVLLTLARMLPTHSAVRVSLTKDTTKSRGPRSAKNVYAVCQISQDDFGGSFLPPKYRVFSPILNTIAFPHSHRFWYAGTDSCSKNSHHRYPKSRHSLTKRTRTTDK